jgi:REP element-mobilizing transposase RayT
LVEQTLLGADGHDYRLQAWVIMPNHVHLVVDVWDAPLWKLIGNWKGKSSRYANLVLHRHGQFWQQDYFDTLARDIVHLNKAIRYIEQNPVKACLVRDSRH